MATNIRSAYLVGSGVLVDATTSVVVQDTRIRSIHATGNGQYILNGTSVTPLGSIAGNIFMFNIASGSDHVNINFADMGIRIDGLVSVAAPTSTSTITVMYG
tara:strand:+ start:4705 stop:5010 length:306 start_codon:yes stop_codon:yes gene_type:complete